MILHNLSSGKRWLRRFQRFRQASDLTSKSKETQVNLLIYSMEEEADGILYSFGLSNNNRKKYNTVLNKFEDHFVKWRNLIYKIKYDMRRQEEGEPVDLFITSLSYQLAEHCNYRDLYDEMIRDRIVVGLWDSNL